MVKQVAMQGVEGCFHQAAAHNYFGKAIATIPCISFDEVIKQVTTAEADAGILAIENSTAGSILHNYDLLQRSRLYIVGEVYLQIRQHLLVNPGAEIGDITEVHSHPMALLQCRGFLEKQNYWHLRETEDTALSAKRLKEKGAQNIAVIASDLAAEIYGLKILQEDIHTEKNNYTRFLILSREEKQRDVQKDHKSSVYFGVENEPGALVSVLNSIATKGVNMSKLQSFPIPGVEWQYYFHADLEFSSLDQFDEAIESIRPLTKKLRILGIYKNGLMA